MQDPLVPVVYTDGACINNPGRGGWAWAVSEELFESGFEHHTTNQRMELQAVIEAVAAFPGAVAIVSDSTYVVNCFRQRWWAGWQRRGWRNAAGQPVANQDLWRPLVEEVVERRPGLVEMSWVKGHGTDPLNNLADRLASEAARNQRAKLSAARPPAAGLRGAATPAEDEQPSSGPAGGGGRGSRRRPGADWEPQRLLP